MNLLLEEISRIKSIMGLIKEEKISLPIKIGTTWSAGKKDADLLHSFERRRSDKKGALIGSQIEEKLKEVYDAGINPDVVEITIKVDSKAYTVTWTATIDESTDGKAYMGVSTRGSAGGGSDERALAQVGPLKRQLTSKGAEDITQILDFDNPTGVPIRQYFFKYTMPRKYPPHPSGSSNYTRTEKPKEMGSTYNPTPTVDAGSSDSTIPSTIGKYSECSKGNFNKWCKDTGTSISSPNTEGNIYKVQGCIGAKQDGYFGNKTEAALEEKTGKKDFKDSDISTICKDVKVKDSDVKVVSTNNTDGGTSDFASITKTVIDKLEGGYWNGSTTKNESTTKMGICKNHPKGSMGASTETMFGLDRYNGNIESTPEGKEFFRIIDEEKQKLGMDGFCQKWKWLYKGGDKEEILKDLAIKNRKASFDRNMSNYVNAETKQKVESIPGLTLHMSYATWNGPGFFKKFAKSLESKIKTGASDKELIDLAINDRSKTGLANKDKTEAAIRAA
jgi:hypothetical protein